MLVFKQLIDCVFLLILVVMVIILQKIHQKYFLPRLKIENYNIEIAERNSYDQSINDLIKQYDEVKKI